MVRLRSGAFRVPYWLIDDPVMSDPTASAQPLFLSRSNSTLSLRFSWHETQSRMDLAEPDALVLEYTRTMMGFLLFKPEPSRVGMIGLGGGSLAKFCHRHLPAARIEVVEIDAQVIALREEFCIPPDSERFCVIEGDGAAVVADSRQRFEVLLVDGYDGEGLALALSSQRFYDDCRASLVPGGVLVVNLSCDEYRCQQQLERIRSSFGGNVLRVDDSGDGNSVVFASSAPFGGLPVSGAARRPRSLDNDAWSQLRSAFERVLRASRELCG
jgi:spermidine synthase